MLYLLDANVLIDASRYYYPIQRVPEFWSWLVHVEGRAEVKIPIEIYEEIKDGDDDLGIWSRDDLTGAALLLTDESDPNLVARVTDQGYADNLTDDEVEKIGRDSFLIAYALTAPEEIRVVSTEVSQPTKLRANRHLPDVCRDFDVECINTFEFVRRLDFSTNWQTR